jgi:aminopeptidase N
VFGHIAAFELRYQLRQPLFWVSVAIFFLLTFGYAASDIVRIGDAANVHKNGPYAIAEAHLVFAIFFMFITTAFVAGAVARDDETGFAPIVRTTRIGKFDYLYGRFAGAFAAATLAYLIVPAALLIGAAAPWLDKELIGPLQPGAYAFSFGVLGLPDLLLTASLFFAMATVTRSVAWTFVGMIAVLLAYFVALAAFGKPELEAVVAPWEPFGMGAYEFATKYWTASDRNTLVPALVGPLLFNRLLVLGLSAGFLALAYPLFRAGNPAGKRPERGPPAPADQDSSSKAMGLEAGWRPALRFGPGATWPQLAARTRMDMALVFKSVSFWVILVFGLANCGLGLWFAVDDTRYGGVLFPVTRALIPILEGAFSLFPIIIAGFFAGELVWRDRDRRMHEIIDATPTPDWMFAAPKALAVSLVLVVTVLISVVVAAAIQAAHGYTRFEFDKYLLWYVLPQCWTLVLMAILAIFIQVVSPNKFAGWGLTLAYLVAFLALPRLGLEHHLYVFGRAPAVPLSDMNRQGRFWIGAAWYRAYWSAIALILLVLAHALWRRGAETRFWPRLRRLPRRLAGPAGWIAGFGAVAAVGAGAFILVNTTDWNPYRTTRGDEAWAADYEKALLRYEHTPQPSVVDVKLNVDLDPHAPRMVARGTYVLENKTAAPLREVHVRFARDTAMRALAVEGAWPKQTYERFNYRIFAFDTPVRPGERRTLSFTTEIAQRGFRDSGNLTSVVDNGTFVNSFDFAPSIGMTRDLLLRDRAKRRKYHLPADLAPAPLGDRASRAYNYVGHASWTTADITVTTDADQIPVAPGYQVSNVVKDGRRTVRFVSDTPILQFFSVNSARYAVRSRRYKDVTFSVYYDPQHAWNVDRMLRALEVSLDYYQANFSPYQFRQARIVEFPDYAQFAQSFAGTFPWSEGLGFIADYRDPTKIDIVTYVAAHEFAHQWWAHQIVGADQQGATALSETLAQYSALRVMRRLYGPDQVRKFLKYELDSYLRARGGEAREEQPLEKVEDQGYIHYRKGSLVMYRLADEIGEDAVNRALRTLLAKYAFKDAPYPTALDLVAAIRAQAAPDKQALITDLFERITLYDLKATAASARRRPDGRWDVRLTVDAAKLYADGKGRETPAPMSEMLWTGVFAEAPGQKGFGPRSVLAFERRPIRSGVQTLAFLTAARPKFAGVDPYDELIDRDSDANTIAVK